MKRERVEALLALVKEKANEFLEDEDVVDFMSAEEIVIVSVETSLGQPVTRLTYGSPVATVNRAGVRMVLGDDLEAYISGEDHEED